MAEVVYLFILPPLCLLLGIIQKCILLMLLQSTGVTSIHALLTAENLITICNTLMKLSHYLW